MTNVTMTQVPAEQDVNDIINGLIGDYFGGIISEIGKLDDEFQALVHQIVSSIFGFGAEFDAEFAEVTQALIDQLNTYQGDARPILFNSVTVIAQSLNDVANGKVSADNYDEERKKISDALQADKDALAELSEEETEAEVALTGEATVQVSLAVLPVIVQSDLDLGKVFAAYVDAFFNGFETGTEADDDMVGGVSGNIMLGLGGDDSMNGRLGDDKMYGGAGDDRMEGGFGSDLMYGGADNDDMFGGSNNDRMFGDGGADQIDGGYGDDRIDGGTGNDILDGGANSDVISGGDGDDLIIGGYGQDKLTGGEGSDTFVFDDFSGKDVITDWESGVDTIQISGWTSGFQNLKVSQNGDDAVISYSFAKIVLEDTDTSTISATDFDFV